MLNAKAENIADIVKNKYDFLIEVACFEKMKKYIAKKPKNRRNESTKMNFDWTKKAGSKISKKAPKKAAFFDRPNFKIIR